MAIQGPPTGLSVNVTDAAGVVTRWGSEDTDPANIPTGISFRTARDGFGDANLTLSRRVDRDYIDINLLDDVQIVGADGSVAYEGRIGASPRTFDGNHSIGLQCAGWIAHARDRQFTEVYVDRDLSHWEDMSRTRKVNLLATYRTWPSTVVADASGAAPAVSQTMELTGTVLQIAEAVYDAGVGNKIQYIYYDFVATNTDLNASWIAIVRVSDDDTFSATTDSANLHGATATAANGYFTASTPRRYGGLQFQRGDTTASTGTERVLNWRNIAVYGNHGVTQRSSAPAGFNASDVMRNIAARFCPKLNTGGIQNTTFEVPHIVFRDLTYPYDAFLELNKYHLWDFGVWENKTLFYKPVDLSDYDWEIRLDDHDYPAAVSLQGDSTQDLANGVTVQYTDVVSGRQELLLPTDYSDLRDPAVDNPFTTHGLQGWKPYQVTVPTTQAGALQLGRAALAEFNQPMAPGSITIGPHVRDRAGHPQAAWKVRAGDRVAITSSTSLSDRPRVISETSYSHEDRKVTMSLDGGTKRLDAVIDRMSNALAAANLG
jgi:hypothetical protein